MEEGQGSYVEQRPWRATQQRRQVRQPPVEPQEQGQPPAQGRAVLRQRLVLVPVLVQEPPPVALQEQGQRLARSRVVVRRPVRQPPAALQEEQQLPAQGRAVLWQRLVLVLVLAQEQGQGLARSRVVLRQRLVRRCRAQPQRCL
jgi:hypothetical protein